MRAAVLDDKGLPLLLAAGVFLALLTAWGVVEVNQADISSYVAVALVQGAIYLAAVILVSRRPGGLATLVVILIVAVILRAISMTALPYLTTDALRYVWDGRLGWEGINPYLYVPADERLADLRDAEIYPHINQKERAVTIYPPVAQLLFMVGVAIHDGIAGMKAIMLLCEAVTVVALVGWLRAEGLPLSRILIYAWHPLPIWEFASQAHLDAAATAFLALGIWAAVHRRQGWTGALFAMAALVKYFPVVLLPALWRRWDWRLPVFLVATAAIFALPYVTASGTGVLGFLGQHLDNEGYRSGWGFHAVWYLREFRIADPPGAMYVALALVVLLAIAAWAVFYRGAEEFRPERLVLLGAAFVFLTSPHYPWYFGFLCALAVRVPHPALLVMTISCVTLQLPRLDGGFSWTHLYAMTYVLPLIVWGIWEVAIRYSPRLGRLNSDLLRLDTGNKRL
jgi:alpha-1,6-mannosyltransferase